MKLKHIAPVSFCQYFNAAFYLSFFPFLSVLVGPPNRTWRYECTIKVYCVQYSNT